MVFPKWSNKVFLELKIFLIFVLFSSLEYSKISPSYFTLSSCMWHFPTFLFTSRMYMLVFQWQRWHLSQSSYSKCSKEDFSFCLVHIDCLLPLHFSLLAELPIVILRENSSLKGRKIKIWGCLELHQHLIIMMMLTNFLIMQAISIWKTKRTLFTAKLKIYRATFK